MKERKIYKPDIEFWFKPIDGKIVIESPYNRANFKDFLKKENGEWVKGEFRKKSKPKSDEILGFLFGALYPLYVLHNKDIKWEDYPDFVPNQFKIGNLTKEEIDDTHYTFMLDLRPIMTFDLKKNPVKQRDELKKYNQKECMAYVSDVCDWFLENIGFIPNVEKYKKIRDMALLIREKGLEEYQEN